MSEIQHISEEVFFSGDAVLSMKGMLDQPAVKSNRSKNEDEGTTTEYVKWGTNNDFATLLRDDAESNTVISSGLRLLAKILYSGGVVYGKYVTEKGKRDFHYESDAAIESWLRANKFSRQFFTLIYDYVYYGAAYPTFVKSTDGKSVARIDTHTSRAKWCRLSPLNKYGEHDYVFIHPDFGQNEFNADSVIKRKCAPTYNTQKWIEDLKGGEAFVIPIKSIDSGRQYYPVPDWNAARKAGWVAIAKDIAALNKAALKNGIRPMWHIEIHQDFWPMKYGKEIWAKMEPADKLKKAKEFHDDIIKKLSGVDNAGAYISTPLDHINNSPDKAYSLVKITSLENKIGMGKEGMYLVTSREATQHQVVAMGLDSALVGTMPGDGGMGAGSGSNARVNFNMRVLLSKSDQDMLLEFMNDIAAVNKWGDYIWTVDAGLITTLDSGAEASAPAPVQSQNTGVNG